jgi:uncharacterized protein YndB with AHSA1/START domain
MTNATHDRTTTTQVHRVYIKATPQAIWDAITKPEWSERYGYGGRVDYALRPGGAFTAYTSPEQRAMGSPDVAVEGEVIEADPPRKLVQTWHLVMADELVAEPATRLTYEIQEGENGVCKLTVTHDLEGAPKAAAVLAGEMAAEGAGGGWHFVLSDLKSLLETGEPLRVWF